jgi:exodeoxyribonuclease VII small subunit
MSFEQSLKELEKIIEKLESPDLTLAGALDYFEKGVKHMKTCDAFLKNAEGKLKELMAGPDGAFIEKILGASVDEKESEEPLDA